ncbi:MAG: serine/threonine protein kinase [Planctomycetota bacterium]|jgi:predicted Ser/Thr protein kinase
MPEDPPSGERSVPGPAEGTEADRDAGGELPFPLSPAHITLLGEIAIELGYLRRDALEAFLREERTGTSFVGIGESLVFRGLLTPTQLEEVLTEQARRLGSRGEKLFGQIVIELGLASAKSVDMALMEQRRRQMHGMKIPVGMILVQQNVLTTSDIERVLGHQMKRLEEARVIASPAEPEPPYRNIGKYEILSEVGRGGMGVVYKARHLESGQTVALKVLLPAEAPSAEDVERFRQEARTASGLSHPGIVRVLDVGEEKGIPYFAMEFLDGQPLDIEIGENPISPQRALTIVRDIALALSYAHQNGVLHGDLKPSNIFMTSEGKPMLGDFGLAKRVMSGQKSPPRGFVFGTPGYIAPERFEGGRKADARADIFALGAVLYEMLTHRPPFEGATLENVISRVLREEPLPPSRFGAGLPEEIEAICLKCLEKNPADRYVDAEALAADAQRWLSGVPVLAKRRGPISRLLQRARNRKELTLTLLMVFLALVLGAAALVVYLT